MNAADITARFPELASVTITNSSGTPVTYTLDDSKVAFWVGVSAPYFNKSRWGVGSFYTEGLAYWVAHKYATWIKNQCDTDLIDAKDGLNIFMPRVGSSQNVNTRDLVLKEAESEYNGTKYGQKYMQLSRQTGIGGLAI